MRLATYPVYGFAELSPSAKEKALAWYRDGNEYFWWSEAFASIKEFCSYFGVKVTDYSVGAYSYSYMETDAEPANFRGMRLKDLPDRDYMPTGYCLDGTLWGALHTALEENRHGNLHHAFKEAIEAAVKDIVQDMEYQDSDEACEEAILANEYEFYEDGSRAR